MCTFEGAEGGTSPAWLTMTVFPAIVSVALRPDSETLAPIASVSVRVPLPLAGESVTHEAPLAAVQLQPLVVVTRTVVDPPAAAAESAAALRLYSHGAAACVTVTVCPATVSVPVRAVVAVFALRMKVTAPDPDPEEGDTVIHETPLAAVQLHPPVVVMLTVPLPPAAATLCDVLLRL